MHIAIIMDGNGRWAARRGMPRLYGHSEGAQAVRRTVEAAARERVSTLSLYAFSSDNWKRPHTEVDGIFALFGEYLAAELEHCLRHDIRLTVIGRLDRLPRSIRSLAEEFEERTRPCAGLHLRLAVDYSSRDALVLATRAGFAGNRENFARALGRADRGGGFAPDVDLLIRTGGEKRLSDFLLWESAYAELVFLDKMWPEFTGDDLKQALRQYSARERRFGAAPREEAERITVT